VTTHRLRDVAQVLTSNVDKVIDPGEHPVRLCNYVDVYKNNFIHDDMPFSPGSASNAEIKKFRVHFDDVIITKDSETADDIGVPALVKSAADDLICGYHLSILRADRRRMIGPFLYWHLLSKQSREDFGNAANGVTRYGLTLGGIKGIPVNVPDLATQRQIADFLDRETARIDLLIEKKRRLVALLGEKYFADLESVTFPEDTPADQLVPFRWICRIAEGQVDPTSETWRDRMLIAPNHIESKTGRLLATETAEEQGAISGKYAFGKGTVLYSKIRPALAKACIAPSSGMCSADMYPIIPDRRLRPEYLLMQLLSARFTDWATLESMRVAMPKINRETLGGFRLRVPPIATQNRYVGEFALHRAQFEAVTDKINASIDRLKEYRSALITVAVTGQIDVSTYAKSSTTDRRLDAIQEEMDA
jgi:type I restriction enzyme, S subunit